MDAGLLQTTPLHTPVATLQNTFSDKMLHYLLLFFNITFIIQKRDTGSKSFADPTDCSISSAFFSTKRVMLMLIICSES